MVYVTIIAAHFKPQINKWYGFKVRMGEKGTHDNYNVLYNGECNSEYFDTEEQAKEAAFNFEQLTN